MNIFLKIFKIEYLILLFIFKNLTFIYSLEDLQIDAQTLKEIQIC